MSEKETISDELYYKIARYGDIQRSTAEGLTTASNAETAIFTFNMSASGAFEQNVTINLMDPETMLVEFSGTIFDNMDQEGKNDFYALLDDLRDFSVGRFERFKVNNDLRGRFDKNDFENARANSETYQSEDDITMESRMYGSKRKSYHESAGTKLIIKHSKQVDEEVKGSRSRNIESIFVENSAGERFKMPVNHLPTARSMMRHISNEGRMDDAIGKNIVEMYNEMKTLGKFARQNKNTSLMAEGAADILEAVRFQYNEVKRTLESLQKQKGYAAFAESFVEEALVEDAEEKDYSAMRETLTKRVFEYDDDFDDIAPTLDKAIMKKHEYDDAVVDKNIGDRTDLITNMERIPVTISPEKDEQLRSEILASKAILDRQDFGGNRNRENRALADYLYPALKAFHSIVLMPMIENPPEEMGAAPVGQKGDHPGWKFLNAITAMDFTVGKDKTMHKAIRPSREDIKLGWNMMNKWLEGKVDYQQPKQAAVKTEMEAFEAWTDNVHEGDEEINEGESDKFHFAASNISEYAQKIGTGHMDFNDFMKVAELLEHHEMDAVKEIVVHLDTDAREWIISSLAESGFEDARNWEYDFQDELDDEDDFNWDQQEDIDAHGEDDLDWDQQEDIDAAERDRMGESEQVNELDPQGMEDEAERGNEEGDVDPNTFFKGRRKEKPVEEAEGMEKYGQGDAEAYNAAVDKLKKPDVDYGEGEERDGSRNAMDRVKARVKGRFHSDDDTSDAANDERAGREPRGYWKDMGDEESVEEGFGQDEASEIRAMLSPEELQSIQSGDDFYGSAAFEKLFQHYSENGEMPYGAQKARTEMPDEWLLDRLDSIGLFDAPVEEAFDYYESVQSLVKLAGIK